MYGRMQGEVGTLSCHFGAEVVEGVVRGHASVECVSPKSSKRGAVEFRVSEGPSGAFLPGTFSFEHLEQVRIVSVRPSVGTLGRGAAVSVVVSGGISSATGLQCRFGTETVMGADVRMMTSSLITCLAPVSMQAGGVLVDVSTNDGADFTASEIEFMYGAGATVERVIPSRGKSGVTGQLLTVVGKHFTRTGALRCMFGVNGAVRGDYMSSTVVTCVAPSRDAGAVGIIVSNDGVDAGTGRAGFVYGTMGSIISITPTSGPKQGGTAMTVIGSNLDGDATHTE